jgi:hypothetical protein
MDCQLLHPALSLAAWESFFWKGKKKGTDQGSISHVSLAFPFLIREINLAVIL